MSREILGIHHVTAITSDAQKNIDFYTGVLGLRLVKLTVNFDDPSSYHLYYGDEQGTPGSILTFFAWPGAPRGRVGAGQVTVTAFSVPAGSLDFWVERLKEQNLSFEGPRPRFDEQVLGFTDPDGMRLELVASPTGDSRTPWEDGPVLAEYAIRGFHNVTLSEEGYESTAHLLTETMGFRLTGRENNRFRFAVAGGEPGTLVDVLCQPSAMLGVIAAGTVHHVAWRTPDDASEVAWRKELAAEGLNVSPVMDRNYFHSIYYREPGGILFEIATDPPGFTLDEPIESLGATLRLPAQFEPMRSQLENLLPRVQLPSGTAVGNG